MMDIRNEIMQIRQKIDEVNLKLRHIEDYSYECQKLLGRLSERCIDLEEMLEDDL